MELLTNYNEDTLQLISDDASTYSLPNLDGDINYTFKLSVFSNINIFSVPNLYRSPELHFPKVVPL